MNPLVQLALLCAAFLTLGIVLGFCLRAYFSYQRRERAHWSRLELDRFDGIRAGSSDPA